MTSGYPTSDPAKRHWKPARPTIHAGVQMRSRLEAGFAHWCDEWSTEWRYEPICLSGTRGQWLPDFLLPTMLWIQPFDTPVVQPQETYVEVKYAEWSDDAELERLVRVFETADIPGGHFVLAKPGSLEVVTFETLGALWREPLLVKVCDTPAGLRIGLAGAQNDTPGPWSGEWWRR